MNPGPYNHRSQNHRLPMDSQYSEIPDSLQSSHRLLSFDGLPRTQPDQNFMNPHPTSATNLFPANYSLTSPMSISSAPLQWGDPNHISCNYDDINTNGCYYEYSPHVISKTPEGPFIRGMNFDKTPRCMPDDFGVHNDHNLCLDEGYEPSSFYTVNPPCKPSTQLLSSTGSTTAFTTLEHSRGFDRLSINTSPNGPIDRDLVSSSMLFDKQSPFRLPSSEASDDGGNSSREMTAIEGEDQAIDEPYAKLIYRALMSKPNHSMVLQEIYQWFRDNTVKGSSDTKGWMNSIRHNLSMNAAFKKTERKVPGDETKKSTEWVLEDFAIKDGVQSTTRYRKGTNAKKFMKTDSPAPARQSSGRRGGLAQRDHRHPKDRLKDRLGSRRPTPCIGLPQNPQYQGGSHAAQQRHRSPLTPPHPEQVFSASPYFFPKSEQFEAPFEEMIGGLEDVQGVYIDDGPLFSNDQEFHFHSGYPISNHPY
ncbi:hypothetical protein N431DRAFT_443992 [Stipitochalara longipes BDJ]|nr:hypothetical protein N431DRAFT_443992 [Stipitochalara longipes BDJ]